MSNFRSIYTGADLDTIFAARVSSPTSNVGFRNADGVDLSQRYEKANSTPATSAVGYRGPDGRDLSQWFTTTTALTVSVTANSVDYNNRLSNTPAMRDLHADASCTVSGGTGPYTYLWEIIDAEGTLVYSLSTTSGNNTTITARASLNIPASVTVRCTVTAGSLSRSSTGTSYFNYYNEV